MSESELARDLHAVLAKAQQGVEVIIEQNHQPVAVLRAPLVKGRLISECIALAKARGSSAVMDDDFARDIEDGTKAHRQPWTPPSWE